MEQNAQQIGEKSRVILDLKTLSMIIGFTTTLVAMWFTLKADIALAMEKPEPIISQQEYDLKDELIRETIMNTQQDVEEIKATLEKMEQRLYKLSTKE